MDKIHKETLQVTKEIIVKFIETGRVSPTNFQEIFPAVYGVVRQTLVNSFFPPVPGDLPNDGDDDSPE